MQEVFRFAILGLGLGALYALASQGLMVIYRGSGILNFAHGSIGMIGSFLGPYAWGVARDATGNYEAGLMAIAIAFLVAGLIVLGLRWWSGRPGSR